MRAFSKYYSKCETVSVKNFLTSKKIFITLQYSGDALRIFLKQTFVECSSNILETFIRDSWDVSKETFIIKSYTFIAKTTFPSRTFKKFFSFKMSPKCSLDAPNIATLREHSANIPGILCAGWVVHKTYFYP